MNAIAIGIEITRRGVANGDEKESILETLQILMDHLQEFTSELVSEDESDVMIRTMNSEFSDFIELAKNHDSPPGKV